MVYDEPGLLSFVPELPFAKGIVFYPGGKVDYKAYAALARQIASKGYLVSVVKLFGDLAVFDQDAGDRAFARWPAVGDWAVAGHSLGGSMGSNFAGKRAGKVEAMIYLAAYPDQDESGTGLRGLSIRGSEDGVLKLEAFESARGKFPKDTRFELIEGGNHGYFGRYGEQAGDGKASIGREEFEERVAEAIGAFLG